MDIKPFFTMLQQCLKVVCSPKRGHSFEGFFFYFCYAAKLILLVLPQQRGRSFWNGFMPFSAMLQSGFEIVCSPKRGHSFEGIQAFFALLCEIDFK